MHTVTHTVAHTVVHIVHIHCMELSVVVGNMFHDLLHKHALDTVHMLMVVHMFVMIVDKLMVAHMLVMIVDKLIAVHMVVMIDHILVVEDVLS